MYYSDAKGMTKVSQHLSLSYENVKFLERFKHTSHSELIDRILDDIRSQIESEPLTEKYFASVLNRDFIWLEIKTKMRLVQIPQPPVELLKLLRHLDTVVHKSPLETNTPENINQ